jgi:hypothetical protein
MSDEKFPAVHIDRRHQSAPRETEADQAVRKAAEEIDGGRWKLTREQQTELNEVPGIALRDGPTPDQAPWSQADFDRTDQSLVLGEHPRVQEALAKLEEQKSEEKIDGQKYAELAAMMHETVEESRRRQRWDGQSRWTEDDAIEARKGQILSPLDFYQRLMEQGLLEPARLGNVHDYAVRQMEWVEGVLRNEQLWVRTIGAGRVLLARDVKKMHGGDRSGRVSLLVMAHTDQPTMLPGYKTQAEEPVQVATLQWPFGTEWMVMKFDEFGVPRTPRFIGWRTALLALIRNGAITAIEAHRAFPVGTGPQASWYKQQIFEFAERR